MSSRKPKAKSKERNDDLGLDAEAVKDLEPSEQRIGAVKGGAATRTCNGSGNMT